MPANELEKTIIRNNSGLVGYWKLENVNDSSTNGYNLTNNNTVTFAAGKFNNGGNFVAASSQSLTINTSSAGNLNITGVQTWVAWIKVAATNTNYSVALIENAADTTAKGLRVDSGGIARFQVTGLTTNTAVSSDALLVAGQWAHIAGVYDGAALRIYVNGIVKSVAATGTASNITDGAFSIGSVRGVTQYYDGMIDDVAIFNVALSADQIKELYEGRYIGEGWPQAGLVAGYHLSDTTDFSGNNYHLTNNNTVTFPQGKFNLCSSAGTANTNKSLSIANNFGITVNGNRTISAWCKMNTELSGGDSYGAFVFQGYNANNVIYDIAYMRLGGINTLIIGRVRNGIGEEDAIALQTNLGTTSWYHLVLTLNGTTLSGYINGALRGTATINTGNGNPVVQDGLIIHANGGQYLSCSVDEVQIYNIAKDANWVRKQYAWAKGMFT